MREKRKRNEKEIGWGANKGRSALDKGGREANRERKEEENG